MAAMGTERVLAESYDGQPTKLRAEIAEFEQAQRLMRSLKLAGPLFGCALLSLPIPVWHFFAVPAFLVAAAVLGLRRYRQVRSIDALEGPCPACRPNQSYAIAPEARIPVSLRCPACGEFLKFRESAESE